MHANEPYYISLSPDTPLPDLSGANPFKAIVIVEDEVTDAWRAQVSDWLVEKGCLYMMACGRDPSRWDDAVDRANLEAFDFGDIPDDKFVLTTWHDKETLDDVFWFATSSARHPVVKLNRVVIVHIGQKHRREEILDLYKVAAD